MAKSSKSSAPASQNRLYLIGGAVALAVVAIFVFRSMGGAGQGATQPVAVEFSPDEVQQAEGVAMGPEDAPVVLYEFADFQCPACAQFSTFAHPLIKERLVDEGIVRLVRYDFPLVMSHPHAFLASRAARCANEQDRYWEYHDILYGRQPNWSALRDPSGEFEDYAELAGVDRAQFSQCLASDRHAEEVTRNMRLGESLGVNGTPTLMLNGERLAVRDYNDLEQRVYEAAGMPAADPAGGN
ncbi:MAG: DsbA family protein [Gemmatimonadota bacterium]